MSRIGVKTFAVMLVVSACASASRTKNDDIAACQASGGRWVENGCAKDGHCERTSSQADPTEDNGLEPAENDEIDATAD